MRTFVIGDIHGCFDELLQLLEKIDINENDWLVSVGDIVDRGAQSKEVFEFFRNRPRSIVLAGNHEKKHLKGVLNYAQEITKLQLGEQYADFLAWAENLACYHETEDAIIVHAAFEHDMPLEKQKTEVLCGTTAGERYLEKKYPEGLWTAHYAGEKPIIYGHHVTGDAPEVVGKTFGIDTGCCHGGYLTAIELPSFAVHQVQARQDHWKETQKTWQVPVLQAKNWQAMTWTEIDKQLAKLSFAEGEAKTCLQNIRSWKDGLLGLLPALKENIEQLAERLQQTSKTFAEQAHAYPFKAYLFKSKAGNLHEEDLLKGLQTPEKLARLALLLGIKMPSILFV